jgi:hypothetical protein
MTTKPELAHLPVDRRLSIAKLIVWPAMLGGFRRGALGATLLCRTGKSQREETPQLNTLRDNTADIEGRPPPKPPFAHSTKPPGYDARDILILPAGISASRCRPPHFVRSPASRRGAAYSRSAQG